MHTLIAIVAATSTTTKSSGKSSSSTFTLLIIVAVFAGVYLFFIRPRQQKLRQQQSATRQLSVGDPVVTAGGIYGHVVALDADVAEIEVANGVVLTVLRRAVNPRPVTTPTEPVDEEWPADPDRPGNPERRFDAGDDEPPGDHPDQHP
jgi:preprotein translocase subunit YajC